MKQRFYVKKTTCPLGIHVCPKEGCRYFSLVVGCNHYEISKRERIREAAEQRIRIEEAAALVRLSDVALKGETK